MRSPSSLRRHIRDPYQMKVGRDPADEKESVTTPAKPRAVPWSLGLAIVFAACGRGSSDSSVCTLYRESDTPEHARTHVATFDASDGEKYNKTNCFIARDLFASQQGVVVRYWCERLRFTP